jgi:hypothetical protein
MGIINLDNADENATNALNKSLSYQASLRTQQAQQPKEAPPPPAGPTDFKGRIAKVGVGEVMKAKLAVQMEVAARTHNTQAFKNANQKNQQNNASQVNTENQLKTQGNPVEKTVAKVGQGIVHAGENPGQTVQSVAKTVAQPFNALAHTGETIATSPFRDKMAQDVATAANNASTALNSAYHSGKISLEEYNQKMKTLGQVYDASDKITKSNLSDLKEYGNPVKAAANAVQVGSYFLGAGETADIFKGLSPLVKGIFQNAFIGVVGNEAQYVATSNKITKGGAEKSGLEGGAFGVGAALVGGVAGKFAQGAKAYLGKSDQATKDVATNVKTNALINSAKSTKANVGDIAVNKTAKDANATEKVGQAAVFKTKGDSEAAQTAAANAAPKNKLLGTGGTQAEGKGFTMSATTDAAKAKVSGQLQKINQQLSDHATGKKALYPDQVKSLVQQKSDLLDQANGKVPDSPTMKGDAATQKFNSLEASYHNESANASRLPKDQQAAAVSAVNAKHDQALSDLKKQYSQSAAVTPKENPSLSQKVSRPPSDKSPQTTGGGALKNTNKPPAKGLGGLVNKAASKLHVSGKVNPEQDLLNKGHTDAAQVVRDISANRDLGNYRGERAQAIFDKNAAGDEQNYTTFASQHEASPNASVAHQHFTSTLQDTGQRGVKAGALSSARGDTYVPRYAKFQDTTKSASIGGLQKTGGFSKGRVQAGEFGLAGDKYKTYAEFKASVENNGGKTSNATTGQVLGHTVASREKAIANADGLAKLEKTSMADGKPAIATYDQSKGLPAKLSGYDINLLPGRAVHPDLAPAIKSFVQNPKANLLTKANAITKRLVTLNGTVHDLNYARSAMGEQGLARTVKGFHPINIVQKGIDSPAYHADTERMIKNGMVTSRTGLTNIFDESNSVLNQKVTGALGKTRGAMDRVTFGIGDNLGRSTYLKVEKQLTGKIGAHDAGQQAADIANRVMFTEREGQQSAEAKSVGKVALFAKNYFQSTIQKATTALGISKNTALSSAAQRAGQVQAAKALAKSFTYLFAAAQAINYHATGHSTFSNQGSKLSPIFYTDKTTGKSYHITNWFGQVGELLNIGELKPSSVTNKLSPAIQEASRLLQGFTSGAPDPYTGQTVINNKASGPRQAGEAAANILNNLITPAGVNTSQLNQKFGKGGQPGKVTGAQFFGFGTSTAEQNPMAQDIANRYYATLPANAGANKSQQLSTLEAAARNDIAHGNKNSANVQSVQKQLSPAAFTKFQKGAANSQVQSNFDNLPTADKLQIVQKYSAAQIKSEGLDLTSLGKALVGSSQKAVIQGLEAKGYSPNQISSLLQKVGIGSQQLQQFKAQAKAQASATARKSRAEPKFVNPLLK